METLPAQILLTIATIGYGFVPMLADFNATHATNPEWPPHARFHVVWQVLGSAAVAVIALYLIWSGGPMATERLYLAGALGVAGLLGFFAAMVLRPMYGGAMYDTNGIQPFKGPIGGMWDVNVTVFTALLVIFIVGLILV